MKSSVKIGYFVLQSLIFVFLRIASDLAHANMLPKIDAHRFDSMPVEISTSGRVYRFSMKSSDVPRVGSIVLVEENKKPSMAFRVLRSDPQKMEYVARRVRRYDNHESLILNRMYPSLEKIADRLDAPPTETLAPAAPTLSEELAPELTPEPAPEIKKPPRKKIAKSAPKPILAPTPAPEPESDPFLVEPTPEPVLITEPASTPEPTPEPIPESTPEPTPEPTLDDLDTPVEEIQAEPILDEPPAPPVQEEPAAALDDSLDQKAADVGSDEEEYSSLEVQEKARFHPYKNMISVQPGSFRNASDFVFGGALYSGFSFGYSFKIKDDWLIRESKVQDSIWLELGGTYYSRAELTNDVYDLLPLRAELRWEIHFSSILTLQFYGGFQYNWIFNTENQINSVTYDNLSGLQATIGTGLIFQIGPQWYLRSDLGYDRINIGLGIRW